MPNAQNRMSSAGAQCPVPNAQCPVPSVLMGVMSLKGLAMHKACHAAAQGLLGRERGLLELIKGLAQESHIRIAEADVVSHLVQEGEGSPQRGGADCDWRIEVAREHTLELPTT
eukprot:CAMPEP_0119327438 /NCGR_PEP_ID=MMETSP1333-20130426/70795_1 /TAXON_ID=418940 /ORGANISM="Scyphosphaera apsteinii, Strain RCC1455" /LENGTH=113 /DNA_ID=CAMNT_0007336027 /DNA_START=259 /DNA_END=602 /DNA_ORIENTATION=+